MFGRDCPRVIAGLVGLVRSAVVLAYAHFESRGRSLGGDWYERLLVNSLPFTILTFIAVVPPAA